MSAASRPVAAGLGVAAFGLAAGVSAQIVSSEDGDVIEVDRAIETTEDRSHGIVSSGADVEIHVYADSRIETSGRRSRGIHSTGANARINIYEGARITTTGETFGGIGSSGIYSSGSNVRVHVHQGARIRTTGVSAYGIDFRHRESESATIRVDGMIETNGQRASGIQTELAAADIHIAETGLIRTMGDNFAHGIVTQGVGSTVTVDGRIETSGQSSFGIFAASRPGAVVTISEGAVVRTTGFVSSGVFSSSADATITVDGTVETVANFADGIFVQAANNDVTVNGRIRTAGVAAHGITFLALDGTATIGGVIEVTGRNSCAVSGTGGQTVRLLPGAQVTGGFRGIARLEAEGFGNSRGGSHSFVAPGVPELRAVNSGGAQPTLVGGNGNTGVIAVLDPTASAMQRDTLAHVTRLIHGAVHDPSGALRSAPASGGRRDWAMAIGGDFARGDDGAALGWDGEVYGAVGGVESAFSEDIRFGVLGAFMRSDFETEVDSIEADTKTAVLGVYGRRSAAMEGGAWDLTGSFLGGYSDQKITRIVSGNQGGRQQANGSNKSWFASASVGARWYRKISDRHELRPSVRVDGLIARHRAYAESSAGVPGPVRNSCGAASGADTSNIAYDSWTSASANGRAQMAIATRLGPTTELEARTGLALRLYADDDLTARLAAGGDSVNYDIPGDDSVYGGFIGARLISMHRDRFSLLADAEYGRGSDDDRALSVRLQLSARF